MTDIYNPMSHSEFSLGRLAFRKELTIEDATAARLFAAVEEGIDELVRAAGREPTGSQQA
jgi:hypothetical protein